MTPCLRGESLFRGLRLLRNHLASRQYVRVPASLVAIPLFAGCAVGIALTDTADRTLAPSAAAAAAIALVAAIGFFLDEFAEGVALATTAGCSLAGISLALVRDIDGLPSRSTRLVRPRRCRHARQSGHPRGDTARGCRTVAFGCVARRGCVRDTRRAGRRGSSDSRWHQADGRRIGRDDLCARGAPEERCACRFCCASRLPTTIPEWKTTCGRWRGEGLCCWGPSRAARWSRLFAGGTPVSEAAATARDWTRRQIRRYVGRWSGQSAAIAIAILIGDRSGLSDEDERRLQEAGTYHVIAISGGNIAILAAILLFLLRLVQLPRQRPARSPLRRSFHTARSPAGEHRFRGRSRRPPSISAGACSTIAVRH